jgi:hypothetical protein
MGVPQRQSSIQKKIQYQPSISEIPGMENSIELPPSGQTKLAISARVEVAV